MHETHIGRYEVVRVLGKGAMGVVCEARDPRLARTVAIKTIRADKLTSAQVAAYEARFLTEARSVARLSHPNIVSVFDSGQADDVTYLVMEFVPGVNLKHCLNHGVRFTPWGAVKVVLDVLAALSHAHGQKILHRDVKPENILLDAAGWVKLTDFGIAKILDADDDNGTQLSGHSIGTPRYMSPEQVRGLPLDERSDLFSAGVLLYELLTARLPFDGGNQFAIAAQILNEAPPLPSARNPAVPAELDAVVARAMAKHPAERFQTGADFVDALVAAVGALGGGDVTARVSGAQSLVAAESAGMLRWLMSRMLTGAGLSSEPDESLSVAQSHGSSARSGPVADGSHLSGRQAGDTAGRQPVVEDGTRLFQREAAELAAMAGSAGALSDGGASISASSGASGSMDVGADLGASLGVRVSHGRGAIDTHATVVVPTVPTNTLAPPVPAGGPLGGGDVAARRPVETGRGRWVWGSAALVLVGVAVWWFAKGGMAPAVAPPLSSPSIDVADPTQTLSAREALVQPAGAPQAASSTTATQGAPATESPKPVAAAPSPVDAVSGGAGAASASTGKKPVKPTDGPAAGKPAEARATGKSEEAQPPPATVTPPKPAAVGTAVPSTAPAEPCTGLGFFERESCLWKQCSTDAHRALAVCERFQARKPAN
ncbi:MAG: protein kinase [Burkholderiales bacterium]|nr:protein kinase [Burkholderiales bacterium]